MSIGLGKLLQIANAEDEVSLAQEAVRRVRSNQNGSPASSRDLRNAKKKLAEAKLALLEAQQQDEELV